jgi:hypothetical protein
VRRDLGPDRLPGMTLTRYPEFDSVLGAVADHAADVLGDDLVGAYVEGPSLSAQATCTAMSASSWS